MYTKDNPKKNFRLDLRAKLKFSKHRQSLGTNNTARATDDVRDHELIAPGNAGKSGKPSVLSARATADTPVPGTGLTISGFTDQDAARWILVKEGDLASMVKLHDLLASRAEVWQGLSDQGIVLATPKSRSALLAACETLGAYQAPVRVVKRPGLHGAMYVAPNGRVFGDHSSGTHLVRLEQPIVPLASAGTWEGWRDLVADHVRGQPVLVLSISLAFAAVVLPLTPFHHNFVVELVGRSSNGKTTALNLAASVFGAPLGAEGSLATTWLATSNGQETEMGRRNGAPFLVDEANLAGFDDPKLGVKIATAAMMLAEGASKARYNEQTVGRTSTVGLSTSNKAIAKALPQTQRQLMEALQVRLITVPVEGACGVFDHVPAGHQSSGIAAASLQAGLLCNHGVALPLFAQRLCDEIQRDPEQVRARVADLCRRFVEDTLASPDNGQEMRRAQHFAVAYAAAKLASTWGILPIKELKAPLLECWRRARIQPANVELSALDRVKAYVENNRAQIHDLDRFEPAQLTDAELDAHPGFLKNMGGQVYLLLRTCPWEHLHGPKVRQVTTELKAADLLWANAGNQLQTRVRAGSTKDRVYAVRIT